MPVALTATALQNPGGQGHRRGAGDRRSFGTIVGAKSRGLVGSRQAHGA